MTEHAVSPDGVIPIVNGDEHAVAAGSTIGDLLRALELSPAAVVVEYNREIVRDRERLDRAGAGHRRCGGDRSFRGWRMTDVDARRGKHRHAVRDRGTHAPLAAHGGHRQVPRRADDMVRAIDASGAEVVTVAVRRVSLDRSRDDGVLAHLDPSALLPALEHGRLLHGGGRHALRAARARGGIQRVGEARGHRRSGHAPSRHRGAARGHAHARGARGSWCWPTRTTISITRAAPRGCRRGRGDAARVADRVGARAPQPVLASARSSIGSPCR